MLISLNSMKMFIMLLSLLPEEGENEVKFQWVKRWMFSSQHISPEMAGEASQGG